ncbi:hypothetical protein A1F94_013100 [Pyrenophora tritici-repentis]|nr:hypothetical protein A1F94_013100 [Pyrenophora tritici-repentis]
MRSRPSKSTTLTTQEGDDWHGGAVFYSPRKLASVRARKAAELDEAPELQLQKARDKEREKQQKLLRKSALKKLQRWLDNKPKLRGMPSSYGSVRRKLPNGHLKSDNNKLQPLKKVAIQQISVSEKPHIN